MSSNRPNENRVRENARAAHSALMSVLAELYNTGRITWDERNSRAEQSYQASIVMADTALTGCVLCRRIGHPLTEPCLP